MEICLVRTKTTDKGLTTIGRNIKVTETNKCFVTESGKRIKKDSLLVSETKLLNNLVSPYLEYHTYCRLEDRAKAKEITVNSVLERFEFLKTNFDKIITGISNNTPSIGDIKSAAKSDFDAQTTYDESYDRQGGFVQGALWMKEENKYQLYKPLK